MSESIRSHGNTSSGSGYNRRALPSRYLRTTAPVSADSISCTPHRLHAPRSISHFIEKGKCLEQIMVAAKTC